MGNFLSINIIVELLCLILSLVFLLKDKNLVWKSWILYLLIICTTELAGLAFKHAHQIKANVALYNVFILFEAGFISRMFMQILDQYTKSKAIIYTGLFVLSGLYIYGIMDHGFYVFNNLMTTVMSVIFTLYGFYYYYLLLKDEQYVTLKYHEPFWWVTGVVFFYFGGSVSNLFFSITHIKSTGDIPFRYFIYLSLNILLYSFWSYSFLCRYLQRNSPY